MGLLDLPSSSGSQPGQARGTFGVDWSKWFPPVTSRTFLSHYLPASGAISHTLYTVHLFSPNIISSIFPTADLAVSNTILFNANVGLGFYVYFRKHLHRVNPWERVEFSVLTSTLFNFGSLLAAVLIKALFPAKSHTWLKSLTATVLSGYLLSRAYKYLGLLDTRTSRGSVSPVRSPTSAVVKPTSRRSVASSRAASVYSVDISPPPPRPQFIMDTPPPSNDKQNGYHNHHQLPMTPSATNYSATEQTVSDFGDIDDENGGFVDKQNYRYLHSFALGNLNQTRPAKENIIRRTTMNRPKTVTNHRSSISNRRPSENMQYACFVTPEPSLKESEAAVYTPPPSRIEFFEPTPEIKKQKKISKKPRVLQKRDELDRMIELVQYHAPLALIPISFGCFVTGTVPMINTIRFIFS